MSPRPRVRESHNAVGLDLDDEFVNGNVDGNDDVNGDGDIPLPNLQTRLDCTYQTLFRLNSCQCNVLCWIIFFGITVKSILSMYFSIKSLFVFTQ